MDVLRCNLVCSGGPVKDILALRNQCHILCFRKTLFEWKFLKILRERASPPNPNSYALHAKQKSVAPISKYPSAFFHISDN